MLLIDISTKQEAQKAIAAIVAEAYAKISEAEVIADTWQTGFSFDLAYGMGGYYQPLDPNDPDNRKDECGYDTGGWRSSSQSC